MQGERPLYWVGASLECLRSFPEEVIDKMGYALHLAQQGGKHPDAKPMKGFTGASVIEVVADHDGNTWRIIYTLKYMDAVYVLHAFQKKSKQGIKTPRQHVNIIRARLKLVIEHYEQSH
jgi:phage-related protein